MEVESAAELDLEQGTSSPSMEDKILHQPTVQFRHCSTWPELGYFMSQPRQLYADTPVFVSVHGISRNAREHMETFGTWCMELGWLLIVPLFCQTSFPRYQQLGYHHKQAGPRADLALNCILDEVQAQLGVDTARILLFGFSGGAQFGHRYTLLHPQRVIATALGSAGWYSFPDPTVAFPRGAKIPHRQPAFRPRLEQLLTIPMSLLVGSEDCVRDSSLNIRDIIDRQQGASRVDRGRHWIDAMRIAARIRGLDTTYRLQLMEGCGHSFSQCVKQGKLDLRVLDFLRCAIEAPHPSTAVPEQCTLARNSHRCIHGSG